MTKGITFVVFGKEYDELAAYAISYSQKFTNLPICVLTNLKNRHSKWKDTKNINFIYLPLNQKDNRSIKTTLIEHSPFDLTLYLDCDSAIQNKGIEKVLDSIEENDLLLNVWGNWITGDKIFQLYIKMMEMTNVHLPVTVYYGAFMGFKKNEQTKKFFNLWNSYWKLGGCGRDMPALMCAVKNSGVKIKELIPEKDKAFRARNICDSEAIVQHEYGISFFNKLGMQRFDMPRLDKQLNGIADDWEKVKYE